MNNMPKHTTRNWLDCGPISEKNKTRVIKDENGQLVAIVWDVNAEANARLIASAPELLEVLKQTEQVFNVGTVDPLQAFVIIEKIKSVIAKAEGS